MDITELIKYSINKVPNQRLYRDLLNGFVKNYGLTILLILQYLVKMKYWLFIHTIQTLRILLSAISYDNIPCLDIIITREK